MLNFCDFIQVYVFTTNHHLKRCMFWSLMIIDGMSVSYDDVIKASEINSE